MRRLSTFLLILSVVAFAACDVLDTSETVILTPTATFEFSFDVSPGDDVLTAASASGVRVSQLLENTFRGDEVIAARVTSVELRRLQPPGRSLNTLFDSATLDLSNGNRLTVASMSSPPNTNRGDMSAQSTDITALLQGEQVRAFLEIEPAEDEREQYAIEARVQFRIELEGI